MSIIRRILQALLLVAFVLMLTACEPTPAPVPTVTLAAQKPSATPSVLATTRPTDPPPTATPSVTPLPTNTRAPTNTPAPTETPLPRRGWSSTASSGTEWSFRYPGGWFGPAQLPFDKGQYVKDPDLPLGMTLRQLATGDPGQLLGAWGQGSISIKTILEFSPESIVAGEPVTISRILCDTRVAEGETDEGLRVVARAAFINRPKDTLEIVWFAPKERWAELDETFAQVLETLELWIKVPNQSIGLQTMHLHDWPGSRAPWEGEGMWFPSPDETMGVAVRLQGVEDPLKLLGAWDPKVLTGLGFADCSAEPTQRIRALNGDHEAKMGHCRNGEGDGVTYIVSYAPNRDRVLEIIAYGPTAEWEYAKSILEVTMSMLVDIRPQ